MNPLALALFTVCGIAILICDKSKAPIALLIGCCYITISQGINIGVNLPFYRLMLGMGLLRVIIRGERPNGKFNAVDKTVIFWGIWCLFASFFHEQTPGSGFKYAIGGVANVTLSYFLIRCWCTTTEDIKGIVYTLSIILVPVAIEMTMERLTSRNMFSAFGGVPDYVYMRNGKLRAQGPFRHAILAGTVGAVCFPLFIGLWRDSKLRATLGAVSSIIIVFASNSSGPIMSLIFSIFALALWKFKQYTASLRKLAVFIYILLIFLMERPPYYLISKIDLTGSSTGWHRAFLIEQTFKHFGEWFLFGTDRTIHWMPGQGAISEAHTDVTNYYIAFGIFGGFLSMAAIIAMLVFVFRGVGSVVRNLETQDSKDDFFVWALGAGMFAHATTSISVSYFDQSLVFYWVNLGLIASCMSVYTNAAHASTAIHDPIRTPRTA